MSICRFLYVHLVQSSVSGSGTRDRASPIDGTALLILSSGPRHGSQARGCRAGAQALKADELAASDDGLSMASRKGGGGPHPLPSLYRDATTRSTSRTHRSFDRPRQGESGWPREKEGYDRTASIHTMFGTPVRGLAGAVPLGLITRPTSSRQVRTGKTTRPEALRCSCDAARDDAPAPAHPLVGLVQGSSSRSRFLNMT